MISRLTRWISWALVGGAAIFATLYAARPITTWDFWWHVKSGEEILRQGSIPERDSFSHTAGDRLWINHEWLFDVILYPVWEKAGGHPIRIATGLILGATILLAAWIAWRWTRSHALSALLTLAFLGLYFGNIMVRPQILSYPFFLWIFDRFFFRRKPPGWKLLAGAAAVMIFWANIHAVALMPVIFYVAWLVPEAFSGPLSRRLPILAPPPEERLPWKGHLWSFALLLACTFASPNGWRLHEYALAGQSFASQFVTEWAPFHFRYAANRNLPVEIYLVVIASLAIAAAWMAAHGLLRRRLDGAETAMIVTCFYFVLTGRRWLWMALIPMAICLREGGALRVAVARIGSPAGAGRRRRGEEAGEAKAPAWKQAAALILTVTLGATLVSPFRKFLPVKRAFESLREGRYFSAYVDLDNVPNDSVQVIRGAGLTGNLFNFYGWGGFLLYTLYPECRVFVDGRAILFPPQVIQDLGRIGQRMREGPELLDRYGVEMTIWPQPWSPPARSPGLWVPFFTGEKEAVWGRAGSANAARAASWYRDLGIPFDPVEGFVAGAALEANPAWARERRVLDRELSASLDPLYEDLRSGRAARAGTEGTIRLRLAEEYLRAGRFPSAGRELRRAYALDPGSAFTVLNLANVEMRLGRADRARRILRTYLDANPGDRQARELLRQAEGRP